MPPRQARGQPLHPIYPHGVFNLIDSWQERDDFRSVFKFKLVAVEGKDNFTVPVDTEAPRRVISTAVKLEVWRRDAGKCVVCGAADELHFDHDLPWAKGGTSLMVENVQLMCARHNLAKRDHVR